MDRRELSEWLRAYERAWRTPGTEALHELFAPDASYRTAPYEQPYRGLEAIAEMWERERVSPDEAFEISAEVVAVEGQVGVASVEVRYDDPPRAEYRDLWIVRLDESGRCVEFDEWPFWPPGQKGHWPPGSRDPV
jgi:SnoaL-like domain